ncbi:UNVERIFIED_CONTAM: hypothetical protein NCL1_19475 [Trichonephila clavipes]
MGRRWCRQFSEGHQSVHDKECSGRPSLINNDLVELVQQRLKSVNVTQQPKESFEKSLRKINHNYKIVMNS